ncbi:MAG: coenzyme F420-0:L-glutamate ligase [Chloroflexi bacterium]|nr:coenzyme F420-0:L-glutamate ligase [Chloroflexota bacterium]
MELLQVIYTAVPGIPLISPGDDLGRVVFEAASAAGVQLADGDAIVFAQKVVSKSEGRLVRLKDVTPSARATDVAAITGHDPRLDELIIRESTEILKMRRGLIVVAQRTGFICANAGIDRSNIEPDGDEIVVSLLPVDPDASARLLRARLQALSGKQLAVLIIDTHGRAFRDGVIGTTIGLAGMQALRDARGEEDLFGFHLQHTVIAPADEIAAGASLLMGQSGEGRPVVVVHGARYNPGEGSVRELVRPRELDLFRPEPLIRLSG